MNGEAKAALRAIRRCIHGERYTVTRHFTERMDQRGLMWPDVLSVIEDPDEIRDDGVDDQGRQKWLLSGPTADGMPIVIVCALEEHELGGWTALFTIYWE